jgi:hypothetical protein
MRVEIPSKYRTKKDQLGYIGEHLVKELFGGNLSENKFDMKKDIVLDSGEFAEVKTQNRDKYRNMFTVNTMHTNQVEKCVSVQRLFFVEYDASGVVKIWECVDRQYTIYETRDGRLMAGWPISKMNLVKQIDDKELADQMKSLSQSRDFSLNSPYAFNKF